VVQPATLGIIAILGSRFLFWGSESEKGRGGEKMKKRIALLITALMLALSMSFGAAGGAFAAKSTTFSKGTCTTKAGQGGGSGEIKDQHHGQCHSQGADV
jgi:hypothetical protein